MADRQVRMILVGQDKSASKTLRAVGKDADGLGKKFAGMSKAGIGALSAVGVSAGAAVGLIASSVGKASDLGETLSKVNNVFKEQSKEIRTWSKTAATALGMSQEEALAAAAQFGDLTYQLGGTRKQAAKTAKEVVQLAADLGSFHNVDPSEVLDKIAGAMRGEFDAVQKLVPGISDARVKTEALRASGKKAAKDLTAQEKAMAALAIITKDSANATNDFAETSGGLANQQRILRAKFDDTRAMLGQSLLPIMTQFANYLNDKVVPNTQRFIDQFQRGVGPGGRFRDTLGQLRAKAAELWPHIQNVYQKTKTVVDFIIAHPNVFKSAAVGVAAYATAMKAAAGATAIMAGINLIAMAAGIKATGAAAGTASLGWSKLAGQIGLAVAAAYAYREYTNGPPKAQSSTGGKPIVGKSNGDDRRTSRVPVPKPTRQTGRLKLMPTGTGSRSAPGLVQTTINLDGRTIATTVNRYNAADSVRGR